MPGSVVRQYREIKNNSQKYVAAKMGISQNAYSKIENNLTQLTVQHLKQLSEILGIAITDLLKDEFEVYKPAEFSNKVSKADLLEKIEILRKKIQAKLTSRSDAYISVLSLLLTIEQSISTIN